MADKFNLDYGDTPHRTSRRIRRTRRCKRILSIGQIWKILFSAVFAVAIFFMGLLIPLRPTVSEIEKRELTKLPQITWDTFWNGECFKGVEIWYADTFPMREIFLSINRRVSDLYGFNNTQFIGDKIHSEEIPIVSGDDTPDFISPNSSSTSSGDPSEASSESSSDSSETSSASSEDTSEASSQASSSSESSSYAGSESENEQVIQSPQQINSVYLLGDTAFGLYGFSQSASKYYASIINNAANKLDGKAQVYSIIAPISYSINLNQATQDSLGLPSNSDAIRFIYSNMNEKVKQVSVFGNIQAHSDEYLFFRTDHHWTALGAYRAYEVFCNTKGIAMHPLSFFETITFERFLGTMYSTCDHPKAMENNPDTVTAYKPRGASYLSAIGQDGEEFDWPIISDVSQWAYHSKYSCFAAGDQAFLTIHNENIKDGSACLIVKDSFGNAFVPFMVDHYEYVYVADPRYYNGGLTEVVDKFGIQDVVFVHNIVTTGATVLSEYVESFINK